MMPVWRDREGRGNVPRNYETFDQCLERWEDNDSIIIFSEGLCIQEWKLRPLSKGSARLVLQAVQRGIPLEIVPVGINYAHFHGPGKSVDLRFGVPVRAADLMEKLRTENGNSLPKVDSGLSDADMARWLLVFNRWLTEAMQPLVVHAGDEHQAIQTKGSNPAIQATLNRPVWLAIARLLHAPLYLPVRRWMQHLCRDTVHFDSVLYAVLMLSYPLYLLLICLMLWFFLGIWATGFVSLWPLSSWIARGR
jgi:hypothetical protein